MTPQGIMADSGEISAGSDVPESPIRGKHPLAFRIQCRQSVMWLVKFLSSDAASAFRSLRLQRRTQDRTLACRL
jgi:hypothetical protein